MLSMMIASSDAEQANIISRTPATGHTGTKPSICRILTHATAGRTRPFGHGAARRSPRATRTYRSHGIEVRAGLLSMFLPTKQTVETTELVNELLETASLTDGGAKTTQNQRTRINELAEQLRKAGGIRDPVYNDLIWGEYEVTYASKPQAAGGPFLRSPPGRVVFGAQQLRQTLVPKEALVNSVTFKALGLFPGNAIQDAVIQTLSGSKYKLTLQPAKIYGVQIGPSRRIERLFNVLYLDEKVRVVEFLPNESPDSNSTVPVLFVMRRLSKVPRHQADTQKQASNQWQNALSTLQERIKNLTGGDQSSAGLATQAERKFEQQNR